MCTKNKKKCICPNCKEKDTLTYDAARTNLEMDIWVCEKCRHMFYEEDFQYEK